MGFFLTNREAPAACLALLLAATCAAGATNQPHAGKLAAASGPSSPAVGQGAHSRPNAPFRVLVAVGTPDPDTKVVFDSMYGRIEALQRLIGERQAAGRAKQLELRIMEDGWDVASLRDSARKESGEPGSGSYSVQSADVLVLWLKCRGAELEAKDGGKVKREPPYGVLENVSRGGKKDFQPREWDIGRILGPVMKADKPSIALAGSYARSAQKASKGRIAICDPAVRDTHALKSLAFAVDFVALAVSRHPDISYGEALVAMDADMLSTELKVAIPQWKKEGWSMDVVHAEGLIAKWKTPLAVVASGARADMPR